MKARIAMVVLFIAAIGVGSVNLSQAASTSGGIILKEGVGARAQGMGETFAGIANDVSSLYWNIGGLSQIKGMELAATYFMGIADSTQQQIQFAYGLGQMGTAGLGISMLQGGMVELDQPNGSVKKVQSQSDLALTAGYGINLKENLGVGLAVKILSSNLAEEYSAMALGVDVGAKLAVNNELSVGATLQNLGTEVKYKEKGDPLPMTARVGAGYALAIAPQHQATLGVDLVKSNDHDLAVHMGAEYWYNRLVAARLGYKAGYDLDSLTAGLGAHWDKFQLDYAFSFVSVLNSTHKVTLSMAL